MQLAAVRHRDTVKCRGKDRQRYLQRKRLRFMYSKVAQLFSVAGKVCIEFTGGREWGQENRMIMHKNVRK